MNNVESVRTQALAPDHHTVAFLLSNWSHLTLPSWPVEMYRPTVGLNIVMRPVSYWKIMNLWWLFSTAGASTVISVFQ